MSVLRKMMEFFGKTFTEEQLLNLSSYLHVDNMRHNPKVNYAQLQDQLWTVLGEQFADPNFTYVIQTNNI